jgi:hypothetical protein
MPYLFRNPGSPVDGTTKANVAQPYDYLQDTTNGWLYRNIGSSANPTWASVGMMDPQLTIPSEISRARQGAAADVNAPAVNTAAVITYAAAAQTVHVLDGVYWSYNAAPTGGNIKIEDGAGTTIFSLDVTAAGPNYIPFGTPVRGTVNTAMIVTLAAAGAAVTGKVNARHWTE